MGIFKTNTESAFSGGAGDSLGDSTKDHELDVNKWLIDHLPNMRPHDKSRFFRTPDYNRLFENLHPLRPSNKGPPIEKTPFLLAFEKLPNMKSAFDNWPPTRPAFDNLPTLRPAFDKLPPMTSVDMRPDIKMFDFKPYLPTPAPHLPGSTMLRALGAVGGIVALMIVAGVIRANARRTQRGRVVRSGAGAVQRGGLLSTELPSIPDDPRTPPGPGEPGRPLINDLPPSYDECALSSTNPFVSEEPPPYTYYKDTEPLVHTRRQNTVVENGLKAKAVDKITTSNDFENVAPEMRMEQVFDNGRIVDRLKLDLRRINKDTKLASNNIVEQHSTRHADKYRLVYVDVTDKLKVYPQ